MNPFKKLFSYYETYHAHGRPLLKYIGIVGAATYIVFYLIRFTRPNPQLFNDMGLRFMVIVLFTILALGSKWPERLKKYYLPYSYIALLICLPFFNVYSSLDKGGGIPAMSNCFIALSFLVMLTDWRNTIAILVAGIALAAGVYWMTAPNPSVPKDMIAQLPAYLIILIGGAAFKLSEKQIDGEKSRLTNALAGSIAHEMRNPLGQIKHSLESMQQALPAPTVISRRQTLDAEAVDELYRQLAHSELAVKRGLQVISMTLNEVSAKPMDTSAFEYLSAAQVCEKAVAEYGYDSDAARDRVEVRVVEDFTFRGDETAYLFVLFNLIKNALYYMSLYPQARITLTVLPLEVKVRDTGPGIAPDLMQRLFEPFRTVGKTGGTGLGLAYCQRVMQAFGGRITCESAQGQYTEFTMSFPPISEQESLVHSEAVLTRARAAFAGKRLLVVDDDASLRQGTRTKLLPLDAQIDEAGGGRQALDLIARTPYDLVVLDLNMPEVDGYAVAQKVRQVQGSQNRDVCIVAYSSEAAHIASVKSQKAGMNGFLSKPCAQLPMIQALLNAIENQALHTRPESAGLAGLRVLLADDHPSNRKAVAAYLRHASVEVLEADHGQAVLDSLQRGQACDAILMDINMPGLNGMETAQAIRASGAAWAGVPVIALTAHSDQATHDAARSAGMNDFITKPVASGLLYAKLRHLTGREEISKEVAPPPPASVPVVPFAEGALLDVPRLESYRRMGMLEELLTDYLPEITRLMKRLDDAVKREDLQDSLDAMHSLLGISGEAGALALYRMARKVYVPMLEQRRWPQTSGWIAQLQELARQTETALASYGEMQEEAA